MTDSRFDDWVVRNIWRLRIVFGLFFFVNAAFGASVDAYIGAVLSGVAGAMLLGGWPALRLFVRSPTRVLRHWYDVLIDARQLHHYHREDGTVEVVRMRPTLHRGWSWREERRWERGDRVSLNGEEVGEA